MPDPKSRENDESGLFSPHQEPYRNSHKRHTYLATSIRHPSPTTEESDLSAFDCSDKVRNVIRTLDKRCQAQAFHIQILEDDKRKLFLQGEKDDRDFTELKALLRRMEKKESHGDVFVFALPRIDAWEVFSMLNQTGERSDQNAQHDADLEAASRLIEARLSDKRLKRRTKPPTRQYNLRKKAKMGAAPMVIEEPKEDIDRVEVAPEAGEWLSVPMQAEMDAMPFDETDPFWQHD